VDGVRGLGGQCVLCDQFSDTVGMGVSPLVRNRRLVFDADWTSSRSRATDTS